MGIILRGIFGCSNRRGFAQYSFFKTPKVVYGQGDATRLLSEERRRLWKAAAELDVRTSSPTEGEAECFHTSLYRHPNPYLSVYFHNIFSAFIYCSYFMKSIGH